MKTRKTFDGVEMNNEIQARLADELAGLSGEEQRRRLIDELAAGDDPVSLNWQKLRKLARAASSKASGID